MTYGSLGLNRPITRRDFLNGVLIGLGGLLASCLPHPTATPTSEPTVTAPAQPTPVPYGGNTNTSFAVCHRVAGDEFASDTLEAEETGELYDLVIVGGGLGGLSAAHFFREQRGDGKVLVLDNHDEFGGHARRHELTVNGQRLIAPQGASYAEAPQDPVVRSLYEGIGLPYRDFLVPQTGGAWLFDETSHGVAHRWITDFWEHGYQSAPWSQKTKRDYEAFWETLRVFYDREDWEAELARLDGMTFKSWIEDEMGWDAEITRMADIEISDMMGLGTDAISAAAGFWFMAGDVREQIYSFPGGCAGFARYIVKALIPDAIGGTDVINGAVNRESLDRDGNDVRIRLNSTVVRVEHEGTAESADYVRVTFAQGNRLYRVRARAAIMAGGGYMTKRVVRDLPQEQREAYDEFIYAAYLVANVWVNNSRAVDALDFGWDAVMYDGRLARYITVADGISLEGRAPDRDPERPNVITLWCPRYYPGLDAEEQCRRGRAELLTTPFETYEQWVREDLVRAFGPYGFDPAQDIVGITLDRWGHAMVVPYPGFAFGRFASRPGPPQIAKQRFGRIAFAHTDVEGTPHLEATYLESHRAVQELVGSVV